MSKIFCFEVNIAWLECGCTLLNIVINRKFLHVRNTVHFFFYHLAGVNKLKTDVDVKSELT